MPFVIENNVVTDILTPGAHIITINIDSVRIFKYDCQTTALKYCYNSARIAVFSFLVSCLHGPSVDRRFDQTAFIEPKQRKG
jgi:hypothetical protein